MQPPEMSVVMPAYNAGRYIREAIQSIQAQSFRRWELIVVDDGSTDDTGTVAKLLADVDKRIRYVRTDHLGVAKAANKAMRLAKADLIVRMDADDISLPHRFVTQYDWMRKHPETDLLATKVRCFGEEVGEGLQVYAEWSNSLTTAKSIAAMRFIDAPVVQPSVCLRRSVIENHGAYRDGDFPEDYEAWLRWLDAGVCFEKINEPLLLWRDHGHKLTRTHSNYSEEAIWRIKGKYFDQWMQHHGPSDARPLMIWGSGRKTRSRLDYFGFHEDKHRISSYIDIDPRKTGQIIEGTPVIRPDEIPIESGKKPFILSMVGSRDARPLIQSYLHKRGFKVEQDYMILA
ncbi:MAG: glycosyltransferase [Opitutales bacterium]|nr:glycosyltransferase [Opitutales bacterium]